MAEISDEELERIRQEAHQGGRSERQAEMEETEQWRAIQEATSTASRTESKLDELLMRLAAEPPAVAAEASEETETAIESDPPAEQPASVQPPSEPEAHEQHRKPKYRLL